MSKELNVTKLIEKYQNGDGLRDAELEVLYNYFKNLYEQSRLLTAEYGLFKNEILRMYINLESFTDARKRR